MRASDNFAFMLPRIFRVSCPIIRFIEVQHSTTNNIARNFYQECPLNFSAVHGIIKPSSLDIYPPTGSSLRACYTANVTVKDGLGG